MTEAPSAITIDKECVTLTNTFFTSGFREQDEIIRILTDLTEVMRHQPGFISAITHRSYDGSTIMDYVQWRSIEHWKAALPIPEAQKHVKLLIEKCRRQVIWYQVTHISQAANHSV
jgi:quinol monooxygenase YgiN